VRLLPVDREVELVVVAVTKAKRVSVSEFLAH
jgi:hypothetical protein